MPKRFGSNTKTTSDFHGAELIFIVLALCVGIAIFV